MLLPDHLILKKTKTYRSWLIGFLGWGGDLAERLELLVCRTHAPGKSLFLLQVPANNHFSASRAPPGFSCPCFINFMKITVFITIVTPNGLLNFMIFFIFVQFPNYRRNRENMIYQYFVSISTVLSSWDPPKDIFFPLKCSKKSIGNAPVKKHENQKTYLKPMKYQHLDILKSN